jgi:hypothetical protein
MAHTTTPKPVQHFCSCGRGFTTRHGERNHGRVCPVERARSAAWINAIETDGNPHAAARAAVIQALATR